MLIIIAEYDQGLEDIGVPRISFFKDGKCGRCEVLRNVFSKTENVKDMKYSLK